MESIKPIDVKQSDKYKEIESKIADREDSMKKMQDLKDIKAELKTEEERIRSELAEVDRKISAANTESDEIRLEELKKSKFDKEQEKADARYYKLENEKNESLEILRHDMNNHLNTMLGMETNSDLKDYITLIMEQYNIKKRTTFSNNNVLNGLISEYSSKCYTENIEFVVDIRPETIDDIVATDIVALFGNILSNAYEAAKQCEENSEKYIELVVKRKHETTFIKCVNSCAVPPKIIGGNFISIKKDSDRKHGYGMKSIDKIVNKYHGSHIEQFDENEFTISIMLMI